MKRKVHICFIIALLLLSMGILSAQKDPLSKKIKYTNKDYFLFMLKKRAYFGFSGFYDWYNFPNAANKQWLSNTYRLGLDARIFCYPLLFEMGMWMKNFGEIKSPNQIPTFQSAKINKYESGEFFSLSIIPFPYIPALKRTQEFIAPYTGIGYQWECLEGWAFDSYDSGYYQLSLSSWYWKVGFMIFLADYIPVDLFVEYSHTFNPDRVRDYEWVKIGITLRYTDVLKLLLSGSKKSYSKPLILPK